ncbi:SURF1 family protein [Novosphingobium album (ex Hu et al. 2023)]|uniref:SURF1-like protein n=1 Tax=Novosphingobium album (ex Hu et al. 2023) TaxID=2930093 RepID=A0ABT0B0H6_9SPHN|nr:SURF1 family protein [Novosphingobium album (ex Hu et al. 2023)]MCJ2178549.1 SURF1 family protein [Novosphingobium album (ex Hu et al. 2023)]
MRRIPVLPTLVVLAAVAMMVSLGVWQLHRLQWKEALLADYAAAQRSGTEMAWPPEGPGEDLLYHRAHLTCAGVTNHSSMAGRNMAGESGMAQTVECVLPSGGTALVVLGWSQQPNAALEWQGGEVDGTIAPGPRLVADPPLAGLQASAKPDPSEIPNNHFAYAIQWFFFAGTALAIYAIALWKRPRQG